jgi:hypothetical protein
MMCIHANLYTNIDVCKLTAGLFILLFIYYFYKIPILKSCVLFLFQKTKYGNIKFIEQTKLLNNDHFIEKNEDILNVVNNEKEPSVTLYITNPKFYELFFFQGEKGLGVAFVEEYFHTDNLVNLFQIIFNTSLEWKCHKYFVEIYKHAMNKVGTCLKFGNAPANVSINIPSISAGLWNPETVDLKEARHNMNNFILTKIDDNVLDINYKCKGEFSEKWNTKVKYADMDSGKLKTRRTMITSEPIFITDNNRIQNIFSHMKKGMIGVVTHNGLFDFKNTFLESIFPDKIILEHTNIIELTNSNGLYIEQSETFTNKHYEFAFDKWEGDRKTMYCRDFLKFLFIKKYLSLTHYFCKK